MKIKYAVTSLLLVWLFIGGSFIYPSINGIAQVVKELPNSISEADAIIQSSRNDSLAYIKSADENTRYQTLLIAKFKKQEKEIEALKKENLLLKMAVNNCDTLVIDNTRKSFWKRIFHRKNKI